MKSRLLFLLLLGSISSLLLAGCGDAGQTPPQPTGMTNEPVSPPGPAPGTN